MKLHTLEIQAFGPFAGKERIDFAKLGDNPLFLIDGPTGAGKSSILHAICYALYGETTDAERKELGLRCDHAEPDLLTELTLEFNIRDDKYRITRAPTQMRPVKKGEGETEHKASAHLRRVLDDGSEETLVTKKKRDADAQVKQIIGLSADQFRQVMVLPQGKFRELLLAKSDDRQTILGTLFQTEVYKRIEEQLQKKAGNIEQQYKKFEESKKDALADVHVADWDALITAIEKAVEVLRQRAVTKDKADELRQTEAAKVKSAGGLLASFKAQAEKQAELRQHQNQSDEVNAQRLRIERAEKAAAIAPKWQTLQAVLADIAAKNGDITKANEKGRHAVQRTEAATESLDKALGKYKQRDQLKAKETQLNGYRDTLAGYESLKKAAADADEAYKKTSSRKDLLITQVADIDKAIQGHLNEEKLLSQRVSQKAAVVKQEIEAKIRYDNGMKRKAANTEWNQLKAAEMEAQRYFDEADAAYKVAEIAADHLEMLWFSNQAAVLAAKLQQDQPCPVCGSLEHPGPAVFETNAEQINQDAVDAARKTQSTCLTLRINADKKLTASQRAVADKQAGIKDLEAALGDDTQRTVAALKQAYAELSDRLRAIETDEQAQVSTHKEKQQKENECEPLQAELKALDDQLPQLITSQAKANSELESAEKGLPEEYRSLQMLEQTVTATSTAITQIEAAYETAQTAQKDAQTAHAAAVSIVTALNSELTKLKARQGDQQSQWQQALADSDFATEADFARMQLATAALEQLRDDVRAYDGTLRDLKTTLALMDEQLKGQQKPDMAVLQQACDVTEQRFKDTEAAWSEAQGVAAQLTRMQQKIQGLEKEQTKVKQQYEVIGKLAKAASGKGEVKVSLERFVLGNLLDSVLSIASQRLHIMSKGQYRLIRQNESDQKRNTAAGLDLAIDDAHSGKARPVATLSGGESFMASLALALALSDVVQQRSGGIQLDTLFVDEGFGSLDQESLQLAINTLVELQATGRTIGIISHVSELKEQMAQRIDVVGSRNGSSIITVA